MALQFTIVPSTDSGSLRLWHGTDIESADCIRTGGLAPLRAAAFGGEGYFFCTTDIERAVMYAKNSLSHKPMIMGFNLQTSLIKEFLELNPALVRVFQVGHAPNFRFEAASFKIINDSMTDVTFTEAKWAFTEGSVQ